MTHAEQVALVESELADSPNDWQLKVFRLILNVPSGHLISYGNLAKWANQEFGLSLRPRNTAWLRAKIYGIVGHETDIPIHRIANEGDVNSTRDHPYTQEVNAQRRSAEGFFAKPRWVVR